MEFHWNGSTQGKGFHYDKLGAHDNGSQSRKPRPVDDSGMGEWLKAQGVTEVFVCGLATDYCVKFTALDDVELEFKTSLIEDASRGVNLSPDDITNSIEETQKAGVKVVNSQAIVLK